MKLIITLISTTALVSFVSGVVVGRKNKNPVVAKIATTQTKENAKIEQKKTVLISEEKKETKSETKNAIYVEKFYNKKGRLTHEINKIEMDSADVYRLKTAANGLVNTVKIDASGETKSSTTETSLSNWRAGVLMPVDLNGFNYTDAVGVVGYRVFSSVYVDAGFQPMKKTVFVGASINF
jgi:predicted methyltransferase